MRAARLRYCQSSHPRAPAAGWAGRRSAHGLVAVVLALSLAACAQATSNLPPIPQSSTPQPGAITQLPPYRVQIGDVLDVKLFLNPELNDEVTVRPDGMISTAVAEDVPAYNRTPDGDHREL